MKGYWIALYKKIDSMDNLKSYAAKVTPIIKGYGGKPLARGGAVSIQKAMRDTPHRVESVTIIEKLAVAVNLSNGGLHKRVVVLDDRGDLYAE